MRVNNRHGSGVIEEFGTGVRHKNESENEDTSGSGQALPQNRIREDKTKSRLREPYSYEEDAQEETPPAQIRHRIQIGHGAYCRFVASVTGSGKTEFYLED